MEAKHSMEILRRVRHDFANHLQVVSGYLELGRCQQVKEYIAEIVMDMAEEKKIFEAGLSAKEALYFFEKTLTARELGIILRYEDLEVNSLDLSRLNHELDEALHELSSQLKGREEEPVVYLSVYNSEEEITMLFSCTMLAQSPVKISIKE
ncbi:Spo0B domain-containing protein [Syntrophomonas wolfei]|uniref:Signal transduction histidine kinase regulating citrate/malate metabolism n=1 Tax=Syntrophomonas wolfei subsp. wolfei (strain DSM 2245B / Goettingen) TaxID=335541 RepID=Q0AWJ3_SYNWW|nr:Spo0B domain-containing protein [Syntrophomonas wolfei]ABI68911.1 signal transduction histidine kinase regulating citrate/malate metabolism [Syntrophomonas wolfei subsp. wolfei str. Goettingen G311]